MEGPASIQDGIKEKTAKQPQNLSHIQLQAKRQHLLNSAVSSQPMKGLGYSRVQSLRGLY